MADEKLFPSIRDIAEKTEALPENTKGSADEPAKEDDDERAVQVIESLCMSCRQQVRVLSLNYRCVAQCLLCS